MMYFFMVYRTLNRQISKITLVFARFFISTNTLMFCDLTVITLHIKRVVAPSVTDKTVTIVSAVIWTVIRYTESKNESLLKN